jgi:hypothetical protein
MRCVARMSYTSPVALGRDRGMDNPRAGLRGAGGAGRINSARSQPRPGALGRRVLRATADGPASSVPG